MSQTNNGEGSQLPIEQPPREKTPSPDNQGNSSQRTQITNEIKNQNQNNQTQTSPQNIPKLTLQQPKTQFGINTGGVQQNIPSSRYFTTPQYNQNNPQVLEQITELLNYLKIQQADIQSQEDVVMEQPTIQPVQQNQALPNFTPNQVAAAQVPTPNVLVPQLTLDRYQGKQTHYTDFLQYLQRQKCTLEPLGIPDVQKKCLLNNHLPSYISNSMLSVVTSPDISLSQFVEQVALYYGPKKDAIVNHMMQQSLGKYESYITFVRRVQELAFFASISDQQLLFILQLRLPSHVTSFISKCQNLTEYIQKLQQVFSEPWFSMVDETYRRTIPAYQGKERQQQGKSGQNQSQENQVHVASISQGQPQVQEKTYQNTVAFLEYGDQNIQNSIQNFAVETRRKRQHIDIQQQQQNGTGQSQPQKQPQQQPQQSQSDFINDQYNRQQQKNNQQYQFQQNGQDSQQRSYQQQGTSGQNTQGNTSGKQGVLEDETIRKLFEKAKANINAKATNLPNPENITKGPRNRRVENIQYSSDNFRKNNLITLDPAKYLNENQQVNFSQILKDICISVPMQSYLHLIGYEIQKKKDQSIMQNTAYFQEYEQPQTYQNFVQNQSVQEQEFQQSLGKNIYKSDDSSFNNLDCTENQLYQYFIQKLQQEQQDNSQYQFYIQNLLSNTKDQEHMCILCTINDTKVVSIIDPGAQKTIISKTIIEKAGLQHLIKEIPLEGHGLYVSGVSGKERIFGIIPRLDLKIQNFEVSWKDVLVQSCTNFDILIGLDVLTLFDFQVGLKNRIVSFIPYPDEPRVTLELCNKPTGQQTQKGSYLTFVTVEQQDIGILEYLRKVYQVYPEFPIYRKYDIIYMDPPWQYYTNMFHSQPPYQTLNFQQLTLLPVQNIANQEGCILLIWVTSTHIEQGIKLIKSWGFNYITVFLVWKKISALNKKTKIGLGYYSRNSFEFLLLATKGKVASYRKSKNKISTISQELIDTQSIEEPRQKYFSSKPYTTYQQIAGVFDLQKLRCIEIFASHRNQCNEIFDLYGNSLTPYFQKQIAFQNSPNVEYNTYSSKIYKSYFAQYFQSTNVIEKYCTELQIGENLPTDVQIKLQTLIKKFSSVFKFDNQFSVTNLGEADITLKPYSKPVRMKPYRIVGEPYQFLKQKFNEYESQGLIKKGQSDWATAVMVVPKDNPKEKYRAVQNFKRVNQLTIKDKYPLRLINDILLSFKNVNYFCVFDLKSGFNQIRRSERSKNILAMILPFGLFLPQVMFFGETNAPSIFQRFMDLAISDMYGKGVECYIDDIVLYSNTFDEMLVLIEQLFMRLNKCNFKLNPEKCSFFVKRATILGHEIEGNKVSPKQKKIDKLLKIQRPNTKLQMQQFLGSINYYRKFLPDLSTLMLPLQSIINNSNKTLQWSQTQQQSFDVIKQFLKQKLILSIPDLQKPFKILFSHTNYTYAAALVQIDGNQEYIVAFHSQMQSFTQNRSNFYIREIDCMVWALNEWRPYIQHQNFIVETDLHAVKFLYESQSNNLQIINYQLQIQDLVFEIQSVKTNRLKSLLLLSYLQDDQELQDTLQVYENIQQKFTAQPSNQKQLQKSKNTGSDFSKFDFVMRFDGASQNLPFNTKIGSGAFVLYNNQGQIVIQNSFEFLGSQTNNCAEYQSLIMGLQYLIQNNYNRDSILIQGDSQLVIHQINYVYMCNSENLAQLCQQARELLKQFKQIKIEHIDRQYNFQCDKLAKEKLQQLIKNFKSEHPSVKNYFVDLGEEIDLIKCVICSQQHPEETMILCDHCNSGYHWDSCLQLTDLPSGDWYCDSCMEHILSNLQSNTYIDPVEDLILINYLKDKISLQNFPNQVQDRVYNRARVYTVMNDKLFKISVNNLREVPTVGERDILVEQIHQLIGHLGQQRTCQLIKQYYYWPNMQYDIENKLRQCLVCSAQNPNYLNMPGIFPISKNFKPMQILYMDCFKMPVSRRGNQFVILAICGTSKWVEGRPIPTANSQDTRDFLFDQIICRYGCPQVVRSDNGPEFQKDFRGLCERLGIIQIFSSPYYPQTNGQVERFNRTIKNGLIKMANSFNNSAYDWEDLLDQVFMGIRFTASRSTKFSPFQSLFGADPILPGYQALQKGITLNFPNEEEQSDYVFQKLQYKQDILNQIQSNLTDMQDEITEVIKKRENISSNNLEYGNLVFVKREDARYPYTKSQGPYVFLGYNDSDRTSAMLINPKNSKIISVNVTKINPIKLY